MAKKTGSRDRDWWTPTPDPSGPRGSTVSKKTQFLLEKSAKESTQRRAQMDAFSRAENERATSRREERIQIRKAQTKANRLKTAGTSRAQPKGTPPRTGPGSGAGGTNARYSRLTGGLRKHGR